MGVEVVFLFSVIIGVLLFGSLNLFNVISPQSLLGESYTI
jgi:hypothetical protein|uniref:Uncharacterized protein n=1 Tax=Siphoviridae sp. ctlHU7 TaxID=2827588 RepID=A0A8S5LI86_9CAUD|nr:MAG TPA: hypothetical protein [Siphoviridae sp. ctlHU7]